MPRKTRRQLIGKQEDIEREEREAALHDLEWELHLAWAIINHSFPELHTELAEDTVSLR